MNNTPCFKCEKRAEGCHGSCPEYQSWSAERNQFLTEKWKAKHEMNLDISTDHKHKVWRKMRWK